MVKLNKPYPWLCSDLDRQGRKRWRLRAPGRPTVTIKGDYGSPEFAANYRAAMEGAPAQPIVAGKHGTFDALARTYLRSADFMRLRPKTQRARRYLVEQFAAKYGTLPVAGLRRDHVKKVMAGLAATPGTARNMLSMLRVLLAVAIDDGIRDDDPTVGIKRPQLSKDGWHAWEEEEVAQYEAKHHIGSKARLALALAACTSQRSSDLIRMGRQHVCDGRINVRQEKTGTRLWIPLHPDLLAIMEATPSEHLTLLVTDHGKPYASANSFGHRMRKWAREAGLIGCPLHGLRKVCLRRLAEAGCSAPEIMAISGHKSLAEVERYIKSAEQKKMADRAIQRTTNYPRADQSYPHGRKKLDASRL